MSRNLTHDDRRRLVALMEQANQEGRDTLYEHEVYGILSMLGLKTAVHHLVHDPEEITGQLLAGFGSDRLVMKIAAPGLQHKGAVGGVRVVHKDRDFLRYTFQRMLTDFRNAGHLPEGILLCEHVAYSQDLGNEILLGFRESETFGPVISFSKGGSDAEHFAASFSAPNLILAPIDRRWSRALLESTHIQEKYLANGNTDHVQRIVDAGVCFSELAVAFSSFFESDSPWVITEFEVNPFVFTPEGTFVAIDGLARFAPRRAEVMPTPPDTASVRPFFDPEGIAVVGVSTGDSTKTGNIVHRNLLRMGREDVAAVNPRGGTLDVDGKTVAVYTGIGAIPSPPELVVVTVPAAAAVAVMEDCAGKGVKAVVLIPGGFSEVRADRELENRISAVARENGIRIMGPNCLGIIRSATTSRAGVNTFFIPESKFRPNLDRTSRVALLSQSGALGITEIDNLRHALSPQVIVSYGNQMDVDPCDLIDYLRNDDGIDVIGCYIEGFKPGAGRRFFDITAGMTKPVIVYKAGRTEAGRKATESHTASIAGEYAVAKAAMKQAGLVVADTMMDHGEFIKTFTLLNDFTVGGNRVAIIANAGYEKTYAADCLGGLAVADLDDATMEELTQTLPAIVAPGPLLDLTPMADDRMFEKCIETMLRSPAVDALFVSVVPQSAVLTTTDSEIEQERRNLATRIVDIVHRYGKPTVVSINVVAGVDALYNRFGQILDSGGVPTFLTANRAMSCLNAFVRYRLQRHSAAVSEWLRES